MVVVAVVVCAFAATKEQRLQAEIKTSSLHINRSICLSAAIEILADYTSVVINISSIPP